MTNNSNRPAIFIDRDGVINENPPHYVKSWQEFHFLPGALEALRLLAGCPWPILIISNQSPVGRGLITRAQLDDIHQRMLIRIRRAGGRIDGMYICPHRPDEGCACRKPAPGLIYQAAAEMGLDLAASLMIGDSLSDVQTARAAGVLPVLLRNGGFPHAAGGAEQGIPPGCLVFDDLSIVVDPLARSCSQGFSPRDVLQLAARQSSGAEESKDNA